MENKLTIIGLTKNQLYSIIIVCLVIASSFIGLSGFLLYNYMYNPKIVEIETIIEINPPFLTTNTNNTIPFVNQTSQIIATAKSGTDNISNFWFYNPLDLSNYTLDSNFNGSKTFYLNFTSNVSGVNLFKFWINTTRNLTIQSDIVIIWLLPILPEYNFPTQKNQWCSNESIYYIAILDVQHCINGELSLDKEIIKIDITDTNNSIDINQIYVIANISLFDTTTSNWTYIDTIRFPLTDIEGITGFDIPLTYNNYTINLLMLNSTMAYLLDTMNYSLISLNYYYNETIIPMTLESNSYMPYYTNESFIDDIYYGIEYSYSLHQYGTLGTSSMEIFSNYQCVSECNSGIPLTQSMSFLSIYTQNYPNGTQIISNTSLIYSLKTILTNIELQHI